MATYAIGDIQGCFQSFQGLLKEVEFNPAQDKLWLAGDLINRGDHSLATLRFVFEHRAHIQCVLGNHDLHFLAVESGSRQPTKKDTFDELLNAPDRAQLVSWLKTIPLIHHDANLGFAMVHAGLPHYWSVSQAIEYGNEVSQFIQSDAAIEFFDRMYGDKPKHWREIDSPMERLRFITNALTRMRYCHTDGSLDLNCKAPLAEAPENLVPWFALERKPLNAELIFGHWASLQGNCDAKNIHAIDTGCVWGSSLTAIRLEDKIRFSIRSLEAH